MFGLGWSELVLIGIVALIVVGPKDLPNLFRTLGQFTGKARQMAREFSRAMESAADEAGVKDVSRTIKAAANPQKFGLDKLRDAADISGKVKPGGETEKLSKEREDMRKRIEAATAKAATERIAREKKKAAEESGKEAAAATPEAAPEKPAKPARKAPAKSAAKPAAKSAAKPAAKPAAKAAAKPKAKPAARKATKAAATKPGADE